MNEIDIVDIAHIILDPILKTNFPEKHFSHNF